MMFRVIVLFQLYSASFICAINFALLFLCVYVCGLCSMGFPKTLKVIFLPLWSEYWD